MKLLDRRWEISNSDWEIQSVLTKELSISPITAQVLINRDISSSAEARLFLEGSLDDLSSPWELPGMEAAVSKILQALSEQAKILIFGDYDVDGMTATTLLISFLRERGAEISYYIPQRSEGYGLNTVVLDWAQKQGFGLIITVDCGISAVSEIAYGKELGLDFVVTDHHEPSPTLPDIDAIVNPKLVRNTDGISQLAGVGVAFKLVQALGQELGLEETQPLAYLDLVALGTIADVVPLKGENRILVKHGLPLLSSSERIGLKALLEVAGLKENELSSGHVAYMLAPRLNAAGRMDSPIIALELLLTNSSQKARELALKLQELNGTRQLLEQQVMKEALVMIEDQTDAAKKYVLVLTSPLWHTGVLGIVASRLAAIFYRPIILMAIEGDQAQGSGRSIPGFDLFKALRHCKDLLLKAGGHSQAVGLTIETAKLNDFQGKINNYARSVLDEKLLTPSLEMEMEVLPEQLDFQLVDELAQLKPFGQGNPEPVLALRHVCLEEYRGVGKDSKHLKFRVATEQEDIDGIGFNKGGLLETDINLDAPVDLAFRLERNHWKGKTRLQLILEDLKEYQAIDLERSESPLPLPYGEECQDVSIPSKEVGTLYQCTHGGEQFQLMLKLIQETMGQGKPVCILFPSQRLLAIYERLLNDSLVKYGMFCQRFKEGQYDGNQNNASAYLVFLAVEGYFQPVAKNDYLMIRLLFPSISRIPIKIEALEALILGFKVLSPKDYEFTRHPVAPKDKLCYLKELAYAGSCPLFIYSNRKQQVMELFHGIRQLLPEKRNRIWYYHQGLCLEQRELVSKAIAHGLADIIIASEFLELQLPKGCGARERVIVDAPYSLEELFLKARPHGDGIKVHGIWHEEELRLNEMTLRAIFPDDQPLEALLHSVMEMGVSREEAITHLVTDLQNKFSGIQSPTVRYVLDIISELQKNSAVTTSWDYKTTRTYQAAEAEKNSLVRLKIHEQKGIGSLMPFFLGGTIE